MSEKQIAPAKPDKAKPEKVKPQSPKPETVKPVKAEAHDGVCMRCQMKPAEIRCLCSDCDLTMQEMHYALEYRLDDKTRYMPEENEPQWFINEGYKLTKPWPPRRRPFVRQVKVTEGPALVLSG